jgi:hypothetical protein
VRHAIDIRAGALGCRDEVAVADLPPLATAAAPAVTAQ